MTYYGAADLAAAYRTVRTNTIAIANEIPEDKYGYSIAPGSRTVAQTLVHIGLSPQFALLVHGQKATDLKTVNFQDLFIKLHAEEAKPRAKAEIVSFLTSEGEAFATFLSGLSDDFLAERVTQMPGSTPATKTRFEMLLSPKEHEMHHRGQLMLVERALGIVPHLTRQMQERMAALAARRS